MKQRRGNDQQLELALSSVLPHARFEGRSVLLIAEVAEALRCDDRHVLNLIDRGRLVAVNISTGAAIEKGGVSKTMRRCLRVPVSAYDAFVRASAVEN